MNGVTLSPFLVQIVEKMCVPVVMTEALSPDEPGSKIVYANPAFLRQTGYELDEVLGRSPHILVGPRTDLATVERLVSTVRSRESFEDEMWIHRKDGTPCRVRWNITPLVNDDGDITHFFAIQEDVTPQLALIQDLLRRPRLSFEGLSLPGVIQVLEMETRSCLLQVTKGDRRGKLYFERGKLLGAEIDDRHGNGAAMEILSWSRADLELVPLTEKPAKPVTHSVQNLLFESARRQDEMRQERRHLEMDAHYLDDQPRHAPVCRFLEPVMEIEGAEGLALVDSGAGIVLGLVGGDEIPDLEAEARANAAVVRAQLELVEKLDLDDHVEEICFSLGQQLHLVRVLPDSAGIFLYAVFHRQDTNLVLARRKLEEVERDLNAGKSTAMDEFLPGGEVAEEVLASTRVH